MATITSVVGGGSWNTTATWSTGTVPTAADDVIIASPVTIPAMTAYAHSILIVSGGSLTVDPTNHLTTDTVLECGIWELARVLDDTREVRLDGVLLRGVTPCISCATPVGDNLPFTGNLSQDTARNIIITDPGYIGVSAKLQDITPEGCGRAYARKVSNAVRYLTVTVRIRATKPHYLGMLYRMAEGPFQVLLVTDRAIIKGHIETMVPDQASVGTEYISVRVTVAEGS